MTLYSQMADEDHNPISRRRRPNIIRTSLTFTK